MKQIIVFVNCDQSFALEISKIERIIEYSQPKRVPETSEYLLGVIKYNGNVLPIVDLSIRLYGTASCAKTQSKIVVVQLNGNLVGLVVDEIVGIRTVEDDSFEDASVGEGTISKEYVKGFIKNEDDIIILLETDKIFNFAQTEELLSVE
ncbi:MAG TPA: hypothetical protein DHN33_05875 [Eubacteriaceae bacterium]|nr:hypothetical protein [Eubacteriaceae bacterium]